MEWLFARPTMIGFAVAGGILSLLAMALRKRQGNERLARHTDIGGYVLMGTSMLLFIIIGWRGQS